MLDGIKYALHFARGSTRELFKGVARSPKWRGVRDDHLKVYPTCAACGTKRLLQVHHIEPFHLNKALELDPKNLITLCLTRELCHLRLGHGGNYDAYNPNVVADARAVALHPAERKAIEKKAAELKKFA